MKNTLLEFKRLDRLVYIYMYAVSDGLDVAHDYFAQAKIDATEFSRIVDHEPPAHDVTQSIVAKVVDQAALEAVIYTVGLKQAVETAEDMHILFALAKQKQIQVIACETGEVLA